jgi:hypothetical protein
MARLLALGSVTRECTSVSKALFKDAQASAARPSDNSGNKIKVSVDYCWNDTEGESGKTWGKPVPVRLCAPQILLWTALGWNLTDRPATDRLMRGTGSSDSIRCLEMQFVPQRVRVHTVFLLQRRAGNLA